MSSSSAPSSVAMATSSPSRPKMTASFSRATRSPTVAVPLTMKRQVHPQLKAVHAPAVAADLFRGQLRVNHAGAGGHPLHVAGADTAVIALRVAVLDRAFEHVRD